jgi:hypothetical protein
VQMKWKLPNLKIHKKYKDFQGKPKEGSFFFVFAFTFTNGKMKILWTKIRTKLHEVIGFRISGIFIFLGYGPLFGNPPRNIQTAQIPLNTYYKYKLVISSN